MLQTSCELKSGTFGSRGMLARLLHIPPMNEMPTDLD
jgi:hypothetical protein